MVIPIHVASFPVEGDAQPCPLVGSAHRPADRNRVHFGDHVLNGEHEVRDGGTEHGNGVFDALRPVDIYGTGGIVVEAVGGNRLIGFGQVPPHPIVDPEICAVRQPEFGRIVT
jgi:hypothetical protein